MPKKLSHREAMDRIFAAEDHLTNFRDWVDWRVANDPHAAVGGFWEEMGRLQLKYLKDHGLQPQHTLLDFGCGTLRAGRHFIRFLAAGCYTGVDISPAALEYAKNLVREEGLSDKNARLLLNEQVDRTFADLGTFDFILAQSVFSHLQEPQIEDILRNVHGAMTERSKFFFTFNSAPHPKELSKKDFAYPISWFVQAGAKYGLRVELMKDYPHPRHQKMAVAVKAS